MIIGQKKLIKLSRKVSTQCHYSRGHLVKAVVTELGVWGCALKRDGSGHIRSDRKNVVLTNMNLNYSVMVPQMFAKFSSLFWDIILTTTPDMKPVANSIGCKVQNMDFMRL